MSKENISSLVEMLLYNNYTEIIAEGVTKSELLRTLACALDGLATCTGMWNDDLLVALAMLRMCAKSELTPTSRDIVLKHLSAGAEAEAAANMEWRLFRKNKLRSGLSLQPLVQYFSLSDDENATASSAVKMQRDPARASWGKNSGNE